MTRSKRQPGRVNGHKKGGGSDPGVVSLLCVDFERGHP